MTVVDKDRNCVTLIQSNFHGFGSGHVPGDLGFASQNRGCLFALDEKHANRLEPRKRPFHTIIPALVTKDGKPWLELRRHGRRHAAAGPRAGALQHDRLRHERAGGRRRRRGSGTSARPSRPASRPKAAVLSRWSRRSDPTSVSSSRAMGHRLAKAAPGSFGGYQAIRIDLEHGVLIGGSDPRKDGGAMGY